MHSIETADTGLSDMFQSHRRKALKIYNSLFYEGMKYMNINV